MTAPATWWAMGNPPSRYLRCETPARAIGGKVYDPDAVRWTGLDMLDLNEGVAIWQILATGARLQFARRLLSAGVPVYAETDDDYTRWDESVANATWTAGMPDNMWTASVELHRRATQLVEGLIVSTDRLADVYSDLNPNIHVCRNSIVVEDWKEPVERDDTFRIMWMASASHRVDQRIISGALEWASKQDGVEVVVLGATLQHVDVKRVPWISDPQEYRDTMINFAPDVGVCPLRASSFARGKSDLKALEYGMVGAMPIVSKLDPYDPWRHLVGEACLEAQSVDEWFETLRWCIENKDQVREMAKRARQHVLTYRTNEIEGRAWMDALDVPLHELALSGAGGSH